MTQYSDHTQALGDQLVGAMKRLEDSLATFTRGTRSPGIGLPTPPPIDRLGRAAREWMPSPSEVVRAQHDLSMRVLEAQHDFARSVLGVSDATGHAAEPRKTPAKTVPTKKTTAKTAPAKKTAAQKKKAPAKKTTAQKKAAGASTAD